MEKTVNFCVQIPVSLHAKIREEQEKSGLSRGAYITKLLLKYYEKGEKAMKPNRTLAFQIPEELFNRVKDHLERERRRTGKRLSQRDFIIGLIERELENAEQQEAERREEESHADVE